MNFQRPRSKFGGIEIAPLVDVVFLLLLFFVLSYQSAGESAIRVLLPSATQADQDVDDEIVITIQADGSLFLDDAPHTLSDLIDALQRLSAMRGQQTVTIRADQRLAVRTLVDVVDATRQSGFPSFSIVTRTSE
jgi:biopolymer transport protein ExbD